MEGQRETLPSWQSGKSLGSCMIELYDKKLWTDVKFRCKDHDDDERIHAHTTILAARSPVFQAMFYGALAESKDEITLKDAEKEIFDLLLRYMYSDTVSLQETTASELLQMAHLYQVSSLIDVCTEFIATIIKPENTCEILTLALFYDITILKDACCAVIDKNAQRVLMSNGFVDLKEDVLLYILKGDTFFADEETIFNKVEQWASKRLTQLGLEESGYNIRKILGDLFYQLRLPAMSYEAMVKCTRRKEYLTANEHISIVDFVNGIPETSVSSNSCVSRLPVNETLILDIGDGEKYEGNNLTSSIQIHVAKDVELVSFGLIDIELYFEYYHYMSTGIEYEVDASTGMSNFFDRFTNKVISLGTYRSRWRRDQRRVSQYENLKEIDISKIRCSPEIHGQLSIRGENFTHASKLNTKPTQTGGIEYRITNEIIYLQQPLKLKKSNTTYNLQINLEFNNYSNWRMRCSRNMNGIKCKKGPMEVSTQVSSPYGYSLLKSIQFRNLANR